MGLPLPSVHRAGRRRLHRPQASSEVRLPRRLHLQADGPLRARRMRRRAAARVPRREGCSRRPSSPLSLQPLRPWSLSRWMWRTPTRGGTTLSYLKMLSMSRSRAWPSPYLQKIPPRLTSGRTSRGSASRLTPWASTSGRRTFQTPAPLTTAGTPATSRGIGGLPLENYVKNVGTTSNRGTGGGCFFYIQISIKMLQKEPAPRSKASAR